MISNNKVVKIVDFDISRIEKINQNKDTEVLGTVGFASPEHFGFSQTDQRADIYALGIMLYEMITGTKPYPGTFSAETLNIIKKGKYIKPQCTAFIPEERELTYLSFLEILE